MALLSNAAFQERAQSLRVLIEDARTAEANAFDVMTRYQRDMVDALVRSDAASLELHDRTYRLAHEEWRAAALYTTELRAEMNDLIKQRQSSGGKATTEANIEGRPKSKSVALMSRVMPSNAIVPLSTVPGGFTSNGELVSLDTIACVHMTAGDISPGRKQVVKSVDLGVDSSVGTPDMPLSDAQLQAAFSKLLAYSAAAGNTVTFATVVDYFARKERTGAAQRPWDFVLNTLATLGPLWRARKDEFRRRRVDDPDVDRLPVTFDEFAVLAVRHAHV